MTRQSSGPALGRNEVEIRLLGPLQLLIDDVIVALVRPQVRQVIASLAAARERSMSADALLDELWPDVLPANPRKSLNVVLSRVRSTLDGSVAVLATVGDHYRLDAVRVDSDEFVRLIDLGRRASGADAIDVLSSALDLWRDDPLPECTSAAASSQRTGLVEHRWFAITRLAELLVESGDMAAASTFAVPHVKAEPTRERLVVLCAQALASEGRKSEALRILHRCSSVLRSEHGIEPSVALQHAERSILDGAVDLVDAMRVLDRPSQDFFVGRKTELDMLGSMSRGQAVVVVGEAGIGKSSLLRRSTGLWSDEGLRFAMVVVPSSPDRPLDAVARLCALLAPAVPDLVEEFATTLGRVCRELELVASDVALTRDALIENLAEFIVRAAADTTVVVVDDAHWLDSGSVEVLRTVLAKDAVRIVVGMRPTDDSKLSFLRSGAGGVDVLRLAPLSDAEVGEVVSVASAGRASDDVGALIAQQSGGNALFVRMLLDRWTDGGGLDGRLPTDLLVAVRERLDALAQRTVESLQVAAVIGHSFGLHTLRQIRPNVDSDLENARAAGLILTDPSNDRGEFVHRLVADACYELLAPGRRVVLHDEVGRVLEIDRAAAVEVASHYVRAAELDPHRAVAASFEAAAEFSAGFDWEAAAAQLAVAADVVHRANICDAAIDAELNVRRGIVGRALSSDRYVDDLVAGAKQARELGDVQLMAVAVTELCGHGRSTGAVSVDEQIASLLDEALTLDLPADHRAELCASGSVLLAVTNQTDRGRALYREAHDLAVRLGDVEIEASVLEHAHLGLAHPDDFELLQAAAWRLGKIAGSDPGMRWESAFLRFQTSAIVGDVAPVTAAVEEMRDLTPRVKQRSRDFGMAFTEAAYAQLRGDLELAERHAATTLEVGLNRYPKSWAMNVYSLLLLSIRREQGRLGELNGLLDAQIASAPEFLPFRVSAAAIADAVGDSERAAFETNAVWSAGLAALPFDGFWTSFVVLLAEPTVRYGSSSDAEELATALAPVAGRLSWNGASSGGPVDGALAVLADARGDAVAAAAFRRSATDLVSRLRNV